MVYKIIEKQITIVKFVSQYNDMHYKMIREHHIY